MKTWLNKNFGFSKAEFNGLIALILVIILLKAVPFFYDGFSKEGVDEADVLAKIQNIEIADQQRNVYTKETKTKFFKGIKESKLFYFDPNTLGLEGWQNLGLSPKQAQAIINYTGKGGKFYKSEDLKRMYTISPEMYVKLLPFVKIESQAKDVEAATPTAKFSNTFTKKAAVVIEINNADSLQLQQISGVGPAFARRILAYRNRLGGFVKKEQLREVFGLDSTKFEQIKDQVKVDLEAVKPININTADFETLKRFPYLSFKQMNALLQYRKQHGNFNGIDDLRKVAIINQATIEKIAPYFSF